MSDELQVAVVNDPQTVAVPQPDIAVVVADVSTPVVITSPEVQVVTVEDDVHVVDEVRDIQIVTVGEVGPAGANGADGSVLAAQLTKTAGVSLGGHRAVVPDAVGGVVYADSSTLAHRDKVLGITTGAASAGADATVQTYGELTEPSWNWALDDPVFLGLTGLLTQTPPSSGFVQRVGFPTAATKLFIDIDDSITL